MKKSPENKKDERKNGLKHLMDNNKFVFALSLFIAFLVWVIVAMYASPEESYTIYNVPVTVDTENSIVAQRGYKTFWQSDEKIDVTVTGPRYMVTTLTPDDIIVAANLNKVNTAGVSELDLRVSLRESSQDITISSWSKSSIEVYFDAELTKEFDVQIDTSSIPEHIAEGYQLNKAELTVSKVMLKGPETEINKTVSVIGDIQFPEELMFKTDTVPVTLNLEGDTAADTVSVNKYVTFADEQEYFVNINIDRIAELAPSVEFKGTKTGDTDVKFNTNVIIAKIDTLTEFNEETLPVMTLDYSSLKEGENNYTVSLSTLDLPEGVRLTDPNFTLKITITLS